MRSFSRPIVLCAAGLVLVACKQAEPSAAQAGGCSMVGVYEHETEGVGSARLEFAPDGAGYTVKEAGLANFTGQGTIEGRTLTVDFKTGSGYSGVYTWTLNDKCTHAEGELVFRTGGTGKRHSVLDKSE